MNTQTVLLEAVSYGYKINDSGDLLNRRGIIIQGRICKYGYRRFNIRIAGISKTVYFHKLQAYLCILYQN